MEQGPESHITFFLDYAALANEVVRDVSIQTITIENSKRNYSSYEKQLINEFDLKYISDPYVDISILKNYSGTYHNQELNFSLNVELIGDHLYK
ncbi:hypothetical protein D3C77_730460 [compost metagenome]